MSISEQGGTAPETLGRLPEDHDAALVAGYEVIELVQSCGDWPDLDRLAEQAAAAGWHDVEFMMRYAQLMTQTTDDVDQRSTLAQLQQSADLARDDALLAASFALRGMASVQEGTLDDEGDRLVARAVALVSGETGAPVHQPCGYIACGMAYHRLGLWQLESEMYRRAELCLAEPSPPGMERIWQLNRSVLIFNALEARMTLASEHFEAGQRARARELLGPSAPLPDEDSGLVALWVAEAAAQAALTAAVLGEPAPAATPTLLAGLAESQWPGYAGCVLLADAIRALDAGRRGEAIELARRALAAVEDDWIPSLLSLALSITAQAEPVQPAVQRYAAILLEARAQAHERAVNSALARVRTEQLALDNERLATQAYLDSLTGLANRFALDRHRERLREGADVDSVAVLLIDLDAFKPVNDTYGHAVGDQVLVRIADILRRAGRPTDVVARLGGDEFVLILAGCDGSLARGRAESIRSMVRHSEWSDLVGDLPVMVSVGTAAGPPSQIDDLLARADRDMYTHKSPSRRHEP